MIKESSMIKASDLKVGDKFKSLYGIDYEVATNRIGDVLFVVNTTSTTDDNLVASHLFYDEPDDVDYAKDILNIDLTTNQ